MKFFYITGNPRLSVLSIEKIRLLKHQSDVDCERNSTTFVTLHSKSIDETSVYFICSIRGQNDSDIWTDFAKFMLNETLSDG